MHDKKIFLSIDEYSYSGAPPNLKSAMAYGMVLNEMLRHTDFMKMAALTMGIATLDYNSTGAALNTTGLLYKMYRDQFGTLPVRVQAIRRNPRRNTRLTAISQRQTPEARLIRSTWCSADGRP